MKSILALVAFAALAISPIGGVAHADNRVFIIANQSDGYGIDECLANGEKCGAYAARSYCQSRDFSEATAYRRVDPDEVTSAIPASTGSACPRAGCAGYIAITCHR
mgnify:CR=1 FL=1